MKMKKNKLRKEKMTFYQNFQSKTKNKKCKTLRLPRIAKDSLSTTETRSKKRKVLSFKTKTNIFQFKLMRNA